MVGCSISTSGCVSSPLGTKTETYKEQNKCTSPISLEDSTKFGGQYWPTYAHDNHNTSHNPHALPPRQKPAIKGKVKAGEGIQGFVITESTAFISSQFTSTLYFVDLNNGTIEWEYEANQPLSDTPLVHENTLIIPAGNIVHCIDINEKTTKWHFDTGINQSGNMLVADSTLFIMPTSGPDDIYAIDVGTGELLWQIDTAGGAFVPAYDEGILYVSRQTLSAIDAQDGEILWENGKLEKPIPINGRLIGSGGSDIGAKDPNTGEDLWWFDSRGYIVLDGVATAYRNVYATGGFRDKGEVVCIDQATGCLYWQFIPDSDVVTAPVVANETVIFGTDHGFVYGVDATSGNQLWKVNLIETDQNQFTYEPVLIGDTVYISDLFGNLYSLK
jgi:outer membrane protein assembly factor BamB